MLLSSILRILDQGVRNLCHAKASQFSQRVVTLLTAFADITKPELFDWEMCLVSEETAVFTPYIVILITVAAIIGVCT